jgi:hypothetical protein
MLRTGGYIPYKWAYKWGGDNFQGPWKRLSIQKKKKFKQNTFRVVGSGVLIFFQPISTFSWGPQNDSISSLKRWNQTIKTVEDKNNYFQAPGVVGAWGL